MGKAMYIGVDGKARKVKKAYIGVDNKARKVKKMYMGVDGKARCIFSGGELSYYGLASEGLSFTDSYVFIKYNSAASVGGYALFVGGKPSEANIIDVYNKSLTKSTLNVDDLSYRYYMASANSDSYALFAGGSSSSGNTSTIYRTIFAFNTSLTRISITDLNNAGACLAGTSVDGCFMFGGGFNSNGFSTSGAQSYYSAYDSSLTRRLSGGLCGGKQKGHVAATSIGSTMIFAGGWDSSGNSCSYMTYVNSSLTNSISGSGITARSNIAGGSNGKFAIFGGGLSYTSSTGNIHHDTIDAFDESLTKFNSTISGLSVGRRGIAATGNSDYVLFAGGFDKNSNIVKNIDVYDVSLVRTNPFELSQKRDWFAATNNGDYFLFGGGVPATDNSITNDSKKSVEVYQIS